MKYLYTAEQFLPISIEEAWNFFSSPRNLSVITPPELDFKMLSDLNGKEIYKGMIIDYMVKPLMGIAVHWKTEITETERPFSFTDKQLKGPYKVWEHMHVFVEKKDGVQMIDQVTYELPFGIFGKIIHSLVVRRKLENIFKFRKTVLEKIFIQPKLQTM